MATSLTGKSSTDTLVDYNDDNRVAAASKASAATINNNDDDKNDNNVATDVQVGSQMVTIYVA